MRKERCGERVEHTLIVSENVWVGTIEENVVVIADRRIIIVVLPVMNCHVGVILIKKYIRM